MKKDFIQMLQNHIGQHVEGQASGFSKWLNGRIHRVEADGQIELAFEVRADMCNPYHVLHGGAMAAIIDEVMGLALFIQSEEQATYLALGIHADFTKSAKAGEWLYAKPEVVRIGRKTATMRCTLVNESGQVIAMGSGNFLRMT